MANLRQLKTKIKTFNDFTKVINIQKISIMREIGEIKEKIDQIRFSGIMFNNYLIQLNRKYDIFESGMFSTKKSRIPKIRNLYFIMANPQNDKIGLYSYKLIAEYIRKNHTKNDLYVVIGEELAKYLKTKNINITKIMQLNNVNDESIYRRISWQIYRGYNDMMFVSCELIYLSTIVQKVVSLKIYPFEDQIRQLKNESLQKFQNAAKVIEEINFDRVVYKKDVAFVAERIAKLAIELKVFETMIEYRLSLKLRELQSLDDKEKNVTSEISRVNLMVQRVRKEAITNELITSSVAFSVIGLEDSEEDKL